ncbi:MAG: hypothetical protein WBM00_02385 [Solirubrobacterales bacterium]
MTKGIRQSSAMVISVVALFIALGGTVWAASKLSGKAIKVKSLPGNRLAPHSVPGNRLKPGALTSALSSQPLTGAYINELTLGPVPNAEHAEKADAAQTAVSAETAVNAVNAVNATTVNGHSAGCIPNTEPFAGACWETNARGPATAPDAAVDCASVGGALPEVLQLVAFSEQPGISLDGGREWSGEIVSFTTEDLYGVATVSPTGVVGSGVFSGGGGSASKKYRCVIPLVR